VNGTGLSETLYPRIVGVVEVDTRVFRLRKKTMNLCVCDNEERE
jgi:hypothetical protein